MAVPSDSGETFLREVDENLRRDQLQDIAKKYGVWIAAGVVICVVGYVIWRKRDVIARRINSWRGVEVPV